MEREHRHLDREAQEEGQEDPELQVRRDPHLHPDRDVEAARRLVARHRLRVEVEREDAEEHHHRADQREEEELDRRVQTPRAAPDPDQEVHRDEHDLPEHVEEEHVEGAEDAQHAGLQEQQEDVVRADTVGDRGPRGEDGDRAEERRQQDEQRRDPVDPEDVLDADRGDPGRLLDELEAVSRAVEPEPQGEAQEEAEERDAVGRPAHRVLPSLAPEDRQEEEKGTHERGVGDDGEEVLPVEVHALQCPLVQPEKEAAGRDQQEEADQHAERVALHEAALHRPERVARGCRARRRRRSRRRPRPSGPRGSRPSPPRRARAQARPLTPSPGRTSPSPPSTTKRSFAWSALPPPSARPRTKTAP